MGQIKYLTNYTCVSNIIGLQYSYCFLKEYEKREREGKFHYSKDIGEVEFRRLLTLEQAIISDYKVKNAFTVLCYPGKFTLAK